ncbi:septal ring lytic transglycosylase RlpA family protein [Flavobacterium paronense]|uniref:Probable endolytic peptidoglycan transglycosylase RlpA n=1 Tax=Flavobacterium paronense TaxID=1392775 RepID=A0ABV5GF17_9FLAO
MNNKIFILFCVLLTSLFTSISAQNKHHKKVKIKPKTAKTVENKELEKVVPVVKVDTTKNKTVLEIDSLDIFLANAKLKFLKKNAHASYYASKFNGRRTASGKKFDNTAYTAAHKKLPFGTKLKVTNEANGKFVIVEVTDRGPFSKVREIDLSKRAFMEIASNKNSGVVIVMIEEIIETK